MTAPEALSAPAPAEQASMEVHFQDEQLEQGIRNILNKNVDEAILQEDLEALTAVNLPWKKIKHLDGLQYAKNLTYLNLSGNEIEDLSPLRELTKLRSLDLSHNPVTSLEALAALTALEELSLNGIGITSIDLITHFPHLTYFEANNNEITDIQALETAAQLAVLDLNGNPIADFTPISELPNLVYLNISNTGLSDLSVLKPLSKTLRGLQIGGNRISDLRPLEGMTLLNTLYAENNQIQDLTPLQKMKDLTSLNLRSNLIYDLEPLRSLTKIHHLYLDDNRIWNIEPLQHHKFDTHYDTGALMYGLTLADNYLDLRDSTKSCQLLQKLAGDGHRLNQKKAQRLVIGSTTAYAGESRYSLSTAPFIYSNRTYVPVRFAAERLGAKVTWNQSKKEVTIKKGSTTIRWAVNQKQASVNGKAHSFDTPLLLKKSTTFVPVRFVSELLASDVEYIPRSRSVLIFEGK
jgi:internalin A